MKDILSLLAYPHSINIDLILSDKLLTAYLKQTIQARILKDLDLVIVEDEIELILNIGLGPLSKDFNIRLELNSLVIDSSQLYLDFIVKTPALKACLAFLNLLGTNSIPMLEYDGRNLRVNLTDKWTGFLLRQGEVFRKQFDRVQVIDFKIISNYFKISVKKD